MLKMILQVDGMMCGMCESHINDAIRNAFPIKKVTASHTKGRVVILTEQEIPKDELQSVIDKTGYTLTSVEQEPTVTRLFRRRGHIACILLIVCAVLIVLAGLLYYAFPKTADISDSLYFYEAEVEEQMLQTVQLLDEGDYETLQSMATDRMKSYLTEDVMADAKKQLAEDWGQRVSFGATYTQEVVQMGRHYVVGEINVSYENVSVTYRLTYDSNMKLDGLYMR